MFVHNPHSRALNADGRWVLSSSANDIYFLDIQQTINSLTTGRLRPDNAPLPKAKTGANSGANDILVIGTPTSVMCYDVINNSDLFYKEVTETIGDSVLKVTHN